jgi:hypothetical protein
MLEGEECGGKSSEHDSLEEEHYFDELAKGLARGSVSRGHAL